MSPAWRGGFLAFGTFFSLAGGTVTRSASRAGGDHGARRRCSVMKDHHANPDAFYRALYLPRKRMVQETTNSYPHLCAFLVGERCAWPDQDAADRSRWRRDPKDRHPQSSSRTVVSNSERRNAQKARPCACRIPLADELWPRFHAPHSISRLELFPGKRIEFADMPPFCIVNFNGAMLVIPFIDAAMVVLPPSP